MGWDSECSFLSAIPLFFGHKINSEFGCSGWEPEYSSLGKEQFCLLRPWTSNRELQTLGPKPEPVTYFSPLILILSYTSSAPPPSLSEVKAPILALQLKVYPGPLRS